MWFAGKLSLLVAVGVVCGSFGCGRAKAPWEVVYRAEGELKLDGKPIAGAQLVLTPTTAGVPDSVRPSATTDAHGNFHLSTYAAGDGAPAGEYVVSVVWHPLIVSDEGAVRGDNALPAKYATPQSSNIKVSVAKESPKLAALELTSN